MLDVQNDAITDCEGRPADGWLILELLDKAGWSIHVRAPFAGVIDAQGTPGVVVLAAHRFADVPDLRVIGCTVAECAPQLMVEAAKHVRTIARARSRNEHGPIDDT